MAFFPTPSRIASIRTPTEQFYGAAVGGEGVPLSDRVQYLQAAKETYRDDKPWITGRNALVGASVGGLTGLALLASPSIPERVGGAVLAAGERILETKAKEALVQAVNQSTLPPGQLLSGSALFRGDTGLAREALLTVGTSAEKAEAARLYAEAEQVVKRQAISQGIPTTPKDLVDQEFVRNMNKAGKIPKGGLQLRDADVALRALSPEPGTHPRAWELAGKTLSDAGTDTKLTNTLQERAQRLGQMQAFRTDTVSPFFNKARRLQSKITPLGRAGIIGASIAAGAAYGAHKATSQFRKAEPLLNANPKEQEEFLRKTIRLPHQGMDLMAMPASTPMAHTMAASLAEPVINFMELLGQ